MYAMRKAWNVAKNEVAPWWAERFKEAYASGLDQLATALQNWSDSTRGKRAGPRMGFPRMKSKRKSTPSCRFTTGAIRLGEDRRHVVLPVLGTIRTHESTRKLHRRVAGGTATVKSATVRRIVANLDVSTVDMAAAVEYWHRRPPGANDAPPAKAVLGEAESATS
jgi:putative transposase